MKCAKVVEKALDIGPNYPTALTFLALVLVIRNQLAEADALQARIHVKSPYFLAQRGWFDAMAGRRNDALQILEELNVHSRTSYISPTILALVHMGLGDIEAFKKYLQLSFEERDPLLLFLLVDPGVDSAPFEPFADELRRKIVLPVKGL